MKKKVIAVLLSVAAAILSGTVIAMAATDTNVSTILATLNIGATQYTPPAQMSYQVSNAGGILSYEYTTSIEADSQRIDVNNVTAVIQTHTYAAEDNSQYTYDNQQRLYSYFNINRTPTYQAVALTETECRSTLDQFLFDNGVDTTPYTETSFESSSILTQYQMSIPENDYETNIITANFSNEGILFGVTIYRNDVDAVSNSDTAFFEQELESYLADNGYTDTITNTQVAYRRVNNTLVAYYHLTFKDSGGAFYTESFSIGRDKLFW